MIKGGASCTYRQSAMISLYRKKHIPVASFYEMVYDFSHTQDACASLTRIRYRGEELCTIGKSLKK